MWNDQPARSGDPAATPESDDQLTDLDSQTAWSPDQLTRLEGEWRRLQRSFAFHPHITVQPLRGDPPSEYQIDFRLNTLVIDDAGQLQYANGASVHVWLPPRFPHDPPLVRPLSGLFHPNISWEGFHLESAWQPAETLTNLVRRMGDLLAWRIFDPESVVNPAAMDWLGANSESLPLDAQANFAPSAGGEPLARIVRNGDKTIDAIRQSVLGMQAQLFSRTPPDLAAVRDFSVRTRLALDLFLERDVPDTLRVAAGELHDAARELVTAAPLYDYLRGRRVRLESLLGHARSALEAKSALLNDLKRLAALVPPPESPQAINWEDVTTVLRRIPAAEALQPLQLRLPKVLGDADRHLTAVRSELAAMEREAPPREVPSDSMLGQKLEHEIAAVDTSAAEARVEAADAVKFCEPALERGRAEAAALEQAARYREYLDLIAQGRSLEQRLAEWGAEGVQAYYIKSGDQSYGPFQLEQMVQLDMQNVLARSTARGAIQIFDADTEMPLGKSTEGQVTVAIGQKTVETDENADSAGAEDSDATQEASPSPADQSEQADDGQRPYPMTFELSERCDDLLVQFDFLRRQTQDLIDKIDPAAEAGTNWCGQICKALAVEAARSRVKKDQAKTSQRWRFAMLDLAGIGPLKERIATYHLLARSSEKVPELRRNIKESRAGLKASDERLAEIVRRCGRDVETNQLVVPPRLAQPYADELKYRKEMTRLLRKSSTLLKAIIIRLTRRLKDPKLLGKSGALQLRVLPPLPKSIQSLPISDGDLSDRIVELENLLHTPLGGPKPAANRPPPPASASSESMPVEAEAQPVTEHAGAEGAPTAEAYAAGPEPAADAAPAEYEPPAEYAESEQPGHGEHGGHEVAESADFVVFDEPEHGEAGE